MQNRKGFTIIELLVVVGIIGLLASLAVVSFGSAQQRARDGKRVADMRAVISALQAAALSENAPVLCNATTDAAIAAITLINNVKICSTSCSAANCAGALNVTNNYIRLALVKDPSYTNVCAAVTPAATCDYSLSNVPAPSLSGQNAVFTIGFVTESATPANLAAGNYHTASNTGMQ